MRRINLLKLVTYNNTSEESGFANDATLKINIRIKNLLKNEIAVIVIIILKKHLKDKNTTTNIFCFDKKASTTRV